MVARLTVAFLCLAALAAIPRQTDSCAAAEPPGLTDLVPQKALGAIFFRNINELRTNGDQLFREVGWPFPPSQLLQWAGQELKVNGIVDGDRPCGVAWFPPEEQLEVSVFRLPPAAAAFAIRDLDTLAKRLGTTVEDLKAGKTIHEPGRIGYEQRYYRLAQDYLWITSEKRLFAELSNRMPLKFVIARPRRERMNNCDIIVSFRPDRMDGFGVDHERMMEGFQRWIDKHPELSDEERAALQELFTAFEAMSNIVFGFRVHKDGVEADADLYFDFRKRKAVQAVLRRFNPTKASSSLTGLPDGIMVFSHALQADGKATLPVLNALLPEFGLTRNLSLKNAAIFSEAQQLKLLGLFGEVWRQIKGYRVAVYQNSEPQQHGQLGVVAILDTNDSERIVKEVQELAEFIDGSTLFAAAEQADTDQTAGPALKLSPEGEDRVRGLVKQLSDDEFAVRQSASVRLMLIGEPVRPFIEPLSSSDATPVTDAVRRARRIKALLDASKDQATRSSTTPRLINTSGVRFQFSTDQDAETNSTVHVIDLKPVAADSVQPGLLTPLQGLLGPEWNRLRLVPLDGHLLVMLGSDPSLHRNAIAAASAGQNSLQTHATSAIYGPQLNPAHGAEFHIDVAHIKQLLSQRPQPQKPQIKTVPKDQSPEERSGDQPETEATSNSTATSTETPQADAAATPLDFSSLSFTIEDTYLSIEWRLPVSEIKALNALD